MTDQSDALDLPDGVVARMHGIEVPSAPHFGPNMIRSMNEGRYERRETAAGLAVIGPGARILEMGAGSGIVGAVLARNCWPESLLSIEANPRLIEHIAALYAHNGLGEVAAVRHAVVLSEPGAPPEVDFFLRPNFLGSALEVIQKPEKTTKVRVPVLRYADLKAEFPHDTIMMDIEGAELDFLRHADLTGVDTFIAEIHRDVYGRAGVRELRALLSAQGLVPDAEAARSGVVVYRRM
jgi:FkbM family methyltransferase